MKKSRSHVIPVLSTQVTAIVSVALVLIILGIVGLFGIAARAVSHDIRQQVGFQVMLADNVSDARIAELKHYWSATPYVATVRYASAEDVLNRWKELGGEDDGEVELLGINPFAPEFEIGVTPEYSEPATLDKIVAEVAKMPGVTDVSLHTEVVKSINNTMKSLALVLFVVAGALLLISFVLINNTVRLTVYARRFTIHTMKLVGATAGFIRRPFIWSSVINGVIAGIISIVVLGGLLFYLGTIDPEVLRVVDWRPAAMLFSGLFLAGILICALAAFFAANKYLRLGYDNMFK